MIKNNAGSSRRNWIPKNGTLCWLLSAADIKGIMCVYLAEEKLSFRRWVGFMVLADNVIIRQSNHRCQISPQLLKMIIAIRL
jgi:hypothetical protein